MVEPYVDQYNIDMRTSALYISQNLVFYSLYIILSSYKQVFDCERLEK